MSGHSQRAEPPHSSRTASRRLLCAAVTVLALALALTLASCAGASPALRGAAARTPTASIPPTVTATQTPAAATPCPPAIQAPIAYLIDPYTGVIYCARNADSEVAMASTTKIMTALVAISYGKLDDLITVGADAILPPAQDSVAFLRQGDRLTLRDLLYGLLLPSGDDAAIAIADGVAGSQANFVALMNVEATLLDLMHTHYSDVNGLDAPGLYTSASDLAHLATLAMESQTFATIVATPHYTLAATATHGAYDWSTTNELLTTLAYDGVTGIKTGTTGDAGNCLVFSATRWYGHLLGVVLHDGGFNDDHSVRFTDASALLDWGFAQQLAVAQHWTSIPPGNAP